MEIPFQLSVPAHHRLPGHSRCCLVPPPSGCRVAAHPRRILWGSRASVRVSATRLPKADYLGPASQRVFSRALSLVGLCGSYSTGCGVLLCPPSLEQAGRTASPASGCSHHLSATSSYYFHFFSQHRRRLPLHVRATAFNRDPVHADLRISSAASGGRTDCFQSDSMGPGQPCFVDIRWRSRRPDHSSFAGARRPLSI